MIGKITRVEGVSGKWNGRKRWTSFATGWKLSVGSHD